MVESKSQKLELGFVEDVNEGKGFFFFGIQPMIRDAGGENFVLPRIGESYFVSF